MSAGCRSRLRAARAGRFRASVSKKPSCSALVSSCADRLAGAGEGAPQHRFDALLALEAKVLELVAEQHERRGPGFHPVERRARNAGLGDRRLERGALGRRDPLGERRQAVREAEPGQLAGISCCGFLSSMMVSTHQLLRAGDRLVELRRPPADNSRAASGSCRTDRRSCRRRRPATAPGARPAALGRCGGGAAGERRKAERGQSALEQRLQHAFTSFRGPSLTGHVGSLTQGCKRPTCPLRVASRQSRGRPAPMNGGAPP